MCAALTQRNWGLPRNSWGGWRVVIAEAWVNESPWPQTETSRRCDPRPFWRAAGRLDDPCSALQVVGGSRCRPTSWQNPSESEGNAWGQRRVMTSTPPFSGDLFVCLQEEILELVSGSMTDVSAPDRWTGSGGGGDEWSLAKCFKGAVIPWNYLPVLVFQSCKLTDEFYSLAHLVRWFFVENESDIDI